ncbi:hypothetical protein ACFLSA_04360 [Bacteroidota bacterium]
MKTSVKFPVIFIMIQLIFCGSFSKSYASGVGETNTYQLSTFEIDVTPPMDYKLNYGKVLKTYDLGLRAKGIILLGSGQPIVLVAIDWIGISNESHDAFRIGIANAAGTIPERVAVQALHQHDAPWGNLENHYVQESLIRLETEIRKSMQHPQEVTHIGFGEAEVYKIASNRRILSENKDTVRAMRYTSCPNPSLRAEPEGTIDPMVSLISFWNDDKPLAVLTSYATHPQSYAGTNAPNPDFPGIARFMRQLAVPDALHIHFTGAGGNIGAGKYNDGSHENRVIFANRLADGMQRAWDASQKNINTISLINWTAESVALPPDTIDGSRAYIKYYKGGGKLCLQCLKVNNTRMLFLPGELFVEYQLAAKNMRPDLFVAVAAYGNCGTGYVPTAIAFERGGYEPSAANVTADAEEILMNAMKVLLNESDK